MQANLAAVSNAVVNNLLASAREIRDSGLILSHEDPLETETKQTDDRDRASGFHSPDMWHFKAKQEMQVPSLGQEDAPEKEMATHSSILAWDLVVLSSHGQELTIAVL